mmetsp:Transcript_134872/g.234461  ORF Transcript_134872/g.234461 Transcript_134872/m.234461 type:complete len:155 (+) Transcript_134872:106-570(+)
MGLEDRGVTFGVHDFKAATRSRDDYHRLLGAAGDTRRRIFGVVGEHSTFNARSRSLSYGAPGTDPKAEYIGPRALPKEAHVDHHWPQKVKGGYGFTFQGIDQGIEKTRRQGSLERNIVGNCSVYDDRHVYYGHGPKHYGINSGTRNQTQYNLLK